MSFKTWLCKPFHPITSLTVFEGRGGRSPERVTTPLASTPGTVLDTLLSLL